VALQLQERPNKLKLLTQVHILGCQFKIQGNYGQKEILKGKNAQEQYWPYKIKLYEND
jgi:hypothetical protein